MKILDCTFRDGGYLTDWHWNDDIVNDTVTALNKCGVDIIELGYKSPKIPKHKNSGMYRYCNDLSIEVISLDDDNIYKDNLCFMIDLNDFIYDDLNMCRLEKTLGERSIFKYCRIAIKYHEIEHAKKAVEIAKEQGYEVFVNLMYAGMLSSGQIGHFYDEFSDLGTKSLYLADSFGQITYHAIAYIDRNLLSDGELSYHLHDNCGFALQNACYPKNNYVDASVLGIGRGAGNVDIASLMALRYPERDISPILEVQDKYFKVLKEKYQWGPDIGYLLSAKLDIHPLYNQTLIQKGLSSSERCKILNDIPKDKRVAFDRRIV